MIDQIKAIEFYSLSSAGKLRLRSDARFVDFFDQFWIDEGVTLVGTRQSPDAEGRHKKSGFYLSATINNVAIFVLKPVVVARWSTRR